MPPTVSRYPNVNPPVHLLRCTAAALAFFAAACPALRADDALRVAAAAVALEADDAMVIGGGIHPRYVNGQEGQLRVTAVVVRGADSTTLGLVACDVLMLTRDVIDAALAEVQQQTGIPPAHVLVNATHTHHAPTTVTVHGYRRDEEFTAHVRRAIVAAVCRAHAQLADAQPATLLFRLGQESSVGQNSRLLLGDGHIFWVGQRDDALRPTGPFDPDLPVMAFRTAAGALLAVVFNHSTHTIGARDGRKRSPGFYGLAAQELEQDLAAAVLFLEGASGSTHNLSVEPDEAATRIKLAVRDALHRASPVAAVPLASLKREITVHVRRFDEAREDDAVRAYCTRRFPDNRDPQATIEVFRAMRRQLAPRQAEPLQTWVQALRIGDVAWVGVPGEFFTSLGIEIKRRSPFRYTYVAELANDWIGYIPDRPAFDLGGYQVWTGLHSYVAAGTGEQIVDTAVEMLHELHRGQAGPQPR